MYKTFPKAMNKIAKYRRKKVSILCLISNINWFNKKYLFYSIQKKIYKKIDVFLKIIFLIKLGLKKHAFL